jgi:DNA-binding transcriptional LysR family regulator
MKTGLDEIEVLLDVAAAASISRAARNAKVPTSTLSRAIARLEERLGTPLLRRMARGDLLTPAGRRLVEQGRGPLRALREVVERLEAGGEQIRGRLRLTAPTDFGQMFLGALLAEMSLQYPRLKIQADFSLRVVDLIGEDYDCALRVTTSQSFARSALIAHRLASFDVQLYAAPEYLARRSTPRRGTELRSHAIIGIFGGPSRPIVVQSATERIRLTRDSNLQMNDTFAIREAALAGAGIGVMPPYVARDLVSAGKLVPVLPQLRGTGATVYFVHPPVDPVPPQVTLVRAMLTPRIRELLAH